MVRYAPDRIQGRLAMRANILIAFVLLAAPAAGDDLVVRLLAAPERVPLGAPVYLTAEVANVSGRPLSLAYGINGFATGFSVRRADGKQVKTIPRPDLEDALPNHVLKEIPAGWRYATTARYESGDEPCEWIVSFAASSKGPYSVNKTDGTGVERVQAWQGLITTGEIRVRIEAPSGEDALAFDALDGNPLGKQGILLKKYPTSTYAAYAVYQTMYSFVGAEPADVLKAMDHYSEAGYGPFAHVPDESGDGTRSLAGDQLLAWYDRWTTVILGAHPDIWFADALRLKRAVNLLAEEQREPAAEEFRSIEQGGGIGAERAKEYLALLDGNVGKGGRR